MKRKAAVAFTIVVPGLGQLLLGRLVRGALFLVGVGFCVDVILFAQTSLSLTPGPRRALTWGPAVIAALLWLYAILDALWLARPDSREVQQRIEQHFRQGMIHFLRDELKDAEAEFSAALRLDRDDVDALYHLGLTLKAANERKRARRALLRCRELDEQQKWAHETEQELSEL